MLIEPSHFDEAEMKLEFRRLYREHGSLGCAQALYEMLKAGQWLSEVMLEERAKENGNAA
jgi:hypothetical protein